MEIRGIKQTKCAKVNQGGTPFISKSFALAYSLQKGNPGGLELDSATRTDFDKQSHVYLA